jgi:Spy/CpxP family protein refolding chaperone
MATRRTLVLVCLALVLAAVTVVETAQAQAQAGQGKNRQGGGGGDGLYPGCPLNLNLSPEQKAKMQEVRNAFFKDTISLRADMFKKEQELDAAMLDKAVDIEKAKKLQDDISGLWAQLAQKRLQAQLEARKLLTPEQFAQLPPGCNMGIGPGGGKGCGMGFGPGSGRGAGDGPGRGQGPDAW